MVASLRGFVLEVPFAGNAFPSRVCTVHSHAGQVSEGLSLNTISETTNFIIPSLLTLLYFPLEHTKHLALFSLPLYCLSFSQ